ncbi:threonine dehydratase [Haloactinospora alba]|uniref:Threonine dehydratase n=1 Tax=Haloactinospora alba TaxID=405555 RepID=A0A543NIU6_9ACTN|nr:serine/threonine dehydratase [Haloactinospora alba]TQN31757.1 threonine dehydratase [Haloactinospora alba]
MGSSTTALPHIPTSDDVRAAAARIGDHARRTPVLRTHVDGRPLVLKLEQLQRTGAFKFRGALNALAAEPGTVSVITASGGNHGLGVATAARSLGINATVYVPTSVPEAKARRLATSGAELVRVGEHYALAAEAAHEHARTSGVRYVPAYDDPYVVAGQGTIGGEIAEDSPECDTVVVAVGGGGLAAGVALGSGGRHTVAAEPEGCQSLHAALAAGRPVDTTVDSVASSALGAARLGEVPFAVLRSHPPTPTLVTDEEITAARDRLWEEFRIAAEPAAAVPFAAWLAGRVPGECPCLVICGANTAWQPAE